MRKLLREFWSKIVCYWLDHEFVLEEQSVVIKIGYCKRCKCAMWGTEMTCQSDGTRRYTYLEGDLKDKSRHKKK